MIPKVDEEVGTLTLRNGARIVEYEVVMRPNGKRNPPSFNREDDIIPVSLTLDPESCVRWKDICKSYRIPRYLALEQALRELAKSEHDRTFIGFYNTEYVEPRRIGGQQSHFKLSSEMNALFNKLSWKLADGNRSRLARAAVAYVWHFILNPPFINRRSNV